MSIQQNQPSNDVDTLQNELQGLHTLLHESKVAMDKAVEERGQLQAEVGNLNSKYKLLQTRYRALDNFHSLEQAKFKEELHRVNKQLKAAEQEKERLTRRLQSNTNTNQKKQDQLIEKIVGLEQDLAYAKHITSEIKIKIKRRNEQLKKLEGDVNAQRKFWEQENNELKQILMDHESEIDTAVSQQENIEGAATEQPVNYEQSVEIEEYREKIELLTKDIATLGQSLKKSEEKYNEKNDEIDKLKNELYEIQNIHDNEINHLKSELDREKRKAALAEKEKQDLEFAAQGARFEQKELGVKYQSLKSKLVDINTDKDIEMSQVRQEVIDLERKHMNLIHEYEIAQQEKVILKKQQEKIEMKHKEVKEKLYNVETQLQGQLNEYQQKNTSEQRSHKILKNELESTQDSTRSMQNELMGLQQSLQQVKSEYADYENQTQKELNQLKISLSDKTNQFEIAQKELEVALTEKTEMQGKLNDLAGKLKEAHAEINTIHTQYEGTINQLKNDLEKEKKHAKTLQQELITEENSRVQIQHQLNQSLEKLKKVSNTVEDVKSKSEAQINTVNFKLQDAEQLISSAEEKLEKSNKERFVQQQELDKNEKQTKELQSQLEKINYQHEVFKQESEKNKAKLEKELARVKKDLDLTTRERSGLAKQVENNVEKISHLTKELYKAQHDSSPTDFEDD